MVGTKPVGDLEDFTRLYDASVAAKETAVLLQVRQGRARRTVVMEIEGGDAAAPTP
jgi:hypothetical protein